MALTIDELKELIQTDEHRQLELKKTMGELKDGMHAACAFLNTEGGWLIFGIAPKSLRTLESLAYTLNRIFLQDHSIKRYEIPEEEPMMAAEDIPTEYENKVTDKTL